MRKGYVYIMANQRPTLYIGVTSNPIQRISQHKNNANPLTFTAKYSIHNLVYYEQFDSIEEAIYREKHLKNMTRKEKPLLIRKDNPDMRDLYESIIN